MLEPSAIMNGSETVSLILSKSVSASQITSHRPYEGLLVSDGRDAKNVSTNLTKFVDQYCFLNGKANGTYMW